MRQSRLQIGSGPFADRCRRKTLERAAAWAVEGLESRTMMSLVINPTFDSSVTSLPNAAQVEAAFNYAAQQFENLFSNPITLNIRVVASSGTSIFGQSNYTYSYSYSYQQIKSALLANSRTTATAAAIASLGADPTNGGSFDINFAQAKALGLRSANDPATDGTFTFGSGNDFNYSTTNRAISGEYDFVGVAEHEISEIMGRDAGLGRGTPALYDSYDLFRYTASGVRSITSGATGVYFSIDGGVTDLRGFEPTIDQDDWIDTSPYTPDAFVEYTYSDVENDITPTDVIVMNTLGYTPNTTSAATVTTVNSSNLSSSYGQPVTLSATITPVNGSNETGTVQFKVDGSNFGSPVTLSGNKATLATSSLGVGQHTLTAVYSGDSNFNGSTSTPVPQVVAQATTSTALGSSANPAVFGQPLTFTATVTSGASSTPAGSVTFLDGSTTLGTVALNASGVATYTTSSLAAGSHSITAVYSGNTNFSTSTSIGVSQTIVATPVVTGLSPATGPAAGGTLVTITGSNFTRGTTVTFGGVAATNIDVLTYTELTVTDPAGTGTVDVLVTTPTGTSATSAADEFTYVAPPTVVSVIPEDENGNGVAAGSSASGQRSMITQVEVVFSEPVQHLTSSAFTLGQVNNYGSGTDSGASPVIGADTDVSGSLGTPVTTDGGTTWVIPILSNSNYSYTLATPAYNGTAVIGSLNNGVYHFGVVAADVTALGGPTMSANYTSPLFHRLYGDLSNSQTLNTTDVKDFGKFYGGTASASITTDMDYVGSGVSNTTDVKDFGKAYAITYTYTPGT